MKFYSRKLSGQVSVLAGTISPGYQEGIGAAAAFNALRGIAVSSTRVAFVTDSSNYRIRQITTAGTCNISLVWSLLILRLDYDFHTPQEWFRTFPAVVFLRLLMVPPALLHICPLLGYVLVLLECYMLPTRISLDTSQLQVKTCITIQHSNDFLNIWRFYYRLRFKHCGIKNCCGLW